MMRNVLFVCTGNICRSPLAEGLFRLRQPDKLVFSAGLHALTGAAVDRLAVAVAWQNGIDIGAHQARKLSPWMVDVADLILTMDGVQKHAIARAYPTARHKVLRLGEFGDFDVPDPYGKGLQAFRTSFAMITQGVDDWVSNLRIAQTHEQAMGQATYGLCDLAILPTQDPLPENWSLVQRTDAHPQSTRSE